MSPAAGRDTVHVEWATSMRRDPYNQPRSGIGAYRESIQKSTAPVLMRAFHQAMRKFDPQGVFLNKFGRRLTLQSNELMTDPKVKKCALQDYCVCGKDADCASSQVCGKLGKFNICTDKNPSPFMNIPYTPIICQS